MKRLEKAKRTRKGAMYWRKLRKYRVLNVKRTPPSRIRPKVQKLVNKKRKKIVEMREKGELPYPPLEPNP